MPGRRNRKRSSYQILISLFVGLSITSLIIYFVFRWVDENLDRIVHTLTTIGIGLLVIGIGLGLILIIVKVIGKFISIRGVSLIGPPLDHRASRWNSKQIQSSTYTYIKGLDNNEFEYYCQSLLADKGYSIVRGPLGGPDRGLDIIVKGSLGNTIGIQCKTSKRDKTKIRRPIVQKLVGAINNGIADEGWIMANYESSSDAKEEASRQGHIQIFGITELVKLVEGRN